MTECFTYVDKNSILDVSLGSGYSVSVYIVLLICCLNLLDHRQILLLILGEFKQVN